ncbi:MAG: N-6 DNA methylase [Candidatus Nanoarchaeia archaeon]|nr:N-6 DNA methylase [Candidatus Nanoarchaeia archaeon]
MTEIKLKEQAKQEIKVIIEKYNRNIEKIKNYNEEMTKKDFILPLFRALGWNVEDSSEVSAEEKISKGFVDYSFRLNGVPKFFLEAKSIKEGVDKPDYIKQAISYAWHKSCTWAVLTDFKTIKIFNAEWKTANPMQSHLKTLNYYELLDRFEELWLLSKESFKENLLSKEAERWGKKVKKMSIDQQLLNDFTNFRELLSKSITKMNGNVSEDELDESVQRILDRLIFIRSCEDRELEEIKLLSCLREWRSSGKGMVVDRLKEIFAYFDERYNSKIFAEHMCDKLKIGNDVLFDVITGLYHTNDNSIFYDFSAIEADVLGNIYEQYLGHILKKTSKRAKVEEGHKKRKEHGIYYTPTYIVDYIVKNTIGELLKDKKVNPEKIRILDPACGSGSFLIKAFDTLNEYWKEKDKYYSQTKLDTGSGTTFTRKTNILKNNIFGVDLDKQAVEIAQLNLLLKIAERGHRLPLLQQNIKNGNSLIDDSKVAGDKAFDWNKEFSEVMKEGGFDVVIGNPPYFNMQTTGKGIQNYFATNDKWKNVFRGQSDILYYFILLGLNVLKEKGYLGFITSRYWLESKWADKLREYILDKAKIKQILDFGDNLVFNDANIHTCIVILEKNNIKQERQINQINFKKIANIQNDLSNQNMLSTAQNKLTKEPWLLESSKINSLINKIKMGNKLLEDISYIGKGYDTGLNAVFEIKKDTVNKYNIEKSLLVKDIKNGNIKRYFIDYDDLYMIYLTKKDDVNKFPNTLKYLLDHKDKLTERYAYKNKQCEWYSLSTLRNKQLFDNAKIKLVVPYLSPKNSFALDDVGYYNGGAEVFIIVIKENVDIKYKYLLGILNSTLLTYYMSRIGKKKGHVYRYSTTYLKDLPIRMAPENQQKPIIELVDKMLSLNKKLNEMGDKKTDERAKIEDEIKETDKKIDELVYKLYGITEEEKKIIEESLK